MLGRGSRSCSTESRTHVFAPAWTGMTLPHRPARLPRPGAQGEVLGPEYGRGAGSGSVVFRVELDGKEVWNSGVVEGGKPPKPVALNLGNARTLTLRVTVVPAGEMPAGRTDSTELDNAVWARPLLIR